MARIVERVADRYDVVVGVDTHTDTHTAAVVDRLGAVLAQVTVSTDPDGLARLLDFAVAHTPPRGRRLWAVEGTRAHGQGLCRVLDAAGEDVSEAPKPAAASRRRGGKSDQLDAVAAAHAVLALPLQRVAAPRSDGPREALRLLLVCRRHHSDARTATINLVKALILTADDTLRHTLRGLSTTTQIARLAALDLPETTDLPCEEHTRRRELTTLARQIQTLDAALADNHRRLRALVTHLCPPLLDQPGIGPVTAAIALTAWSHPGRVRSEAAYATLAGTAPIPVASGRTNRHRLNRGGDRTLNSALHTIALTRRRIHPETRDYITRRRTEGRTTKEITRCLKRYIARQIYRTITNHHRTT
ncbi:IS110 family transposase [Micromonospora sp. B006]|uniref:IS110 family transposase n=1 Tax=Micromonospora sp. B006 TaxID=2201999 RepID=UPI000E30469D|nr:IS110 family transposase [Micromonospora sp. B006]